MDPETLKTLATVEWHQSLTGFMVKFGILTAIFIGIVVAFLVSGALRNVVKHWSRFRCNPFIMPFAEFFGYDSAENFQYCVRTLMEDQSSEFFQPIYAMLGEYSSSLGLIINTVNGFRKMLGNFKLSTDSFVQSVMAKIQALMFQLRMTFMRMQTLMGRVYGTMYSIIWMGTSSITAGMNMADNDMVNFLFEFCFAPETRIRMQDGTIKAIQDVVIGDVLENGVRVSSTFVFAGDRTPMVRIGEDVLSGQHRVYWNAQWIPAAQHPAAVPTASIPRLYCLNVEGHAFHTAAGLHVADYDESEDPQAIADVQRLAELHLNGGASASAADAVAVAAGATADYALGFDSQADIQLATGAWKPVSALEIGDVLQGGATVCGLVKEHCSRVFKYGDILFASAQLLYVENAWKRAETLQHSTPATSAILTQCITDTCAPLFIRKDATTLAVRDYREAPLPEMEEPYLNAMV